MKKGKKRAKNKKTIHPFHFKSKNKPLTSYKPGNFLLKKKKKKKKNGQQSNNKMVICHIIVIEIDHFHFSYQ